MRLFLRALVALVLCAGAARAQQPTHRIEATDRQKVSATITYELKTKTFAVSKWMLFLPEPPELPSQGVAKVTTAPVGKVVVDKSPIERKVRYIEVRVTDPVPGGGLVMTLEVEAVLRSRRLVELAGDEKPPVVAPLTDAERKYYLSATTHVDHGAKEVREWLDAKKLHPTRGEALIEFAARVMEVIRSDYRYNFDTTEEKRASVVCRARTTDCGGMSYLFVAALRANDIPARVLVGRQALPRKPDSAPTDTGHDRPHMRAEFFVAGVGWVPVDPALAHAFRNRPVSAFVGHDPGDVLVLHVDVDLQLPFPEKVRECQLLQLGPAYWTLGRGTFDGSFGPTGWDVKTSPLEKK
jgi:transglutaminase-like putative cysteine protease